MSSKKKKQVASLLQRFEFTDFATIVATSPIKRKDGLRKYVDRDSKGRWPSYKGFRSLIPDIVGVARGLDPTDVFDMSNIEKGLKMRCHKDDLPRNIDAAKCLYSFVRPMTFSAYDDHPRNPLYISHDRTISMRVEHYIVDGDRGAFQFINPRAEPFSADALRIAMSLIHHNYVSGDFEAFDVEVIELSRELIIGPRGGLKYVGDRVASISRLPRDELADRVWLNEQANSVYALLMELAEEP